MEFVAVGCLVLVAMLAGIWAYALVGTLKKLNQQEAAATADDVETDDCKTEQEESAPEEKNPIAAFLETAKRLLPRRWMLLGVCATLIGLAAVKLLAFEPGGLHGMRLAAAAVLLLPTMIVDMNTRTIPNTLVLAMLVVGTVFYGMHFFAEPDAFGGTILDAVIGLLGCLILFYVMSRLTKDGMGMGDVKQLAALGWMIGLRGALVSALFSLLACAMAAIVLLVSKKKNTKDSVPFGPFIFFGYLLAVLICNF